jgi:hypothetical protein
MIITVLSIPGAIEHFSPDSVIATLGKSTTRAYN